MQAKEFLLKFSRDELTDVYYNFFLKGLNDSEEETEEKRKQAEEIVGKAYDDMLSADSHPEDGIRGAAWTWMLENDLELIPEGKEKEYAAALIGTYRRIVENSEIGSLARAAEEEKKRKEERKKRLDAEAGALSEAALAVAEAGDVIEKATEQKMVQRFDEARRIEEEDRKAEEEEKIEEEFADSDDFEIETKTAIDSRIASDEDTKTKKVCKKRKAAMRKQVRKKERRKASVAKKRRKK